MTSNLTHLYHQIKRKRDDLAIGYHIRNGIHSIASTVYPYARILLPNFRAVHYFYILMMVFLGSAIVYPVKSVAYVDILFFTAGSSTQAGLNTVDVMKTSLYQQIMFYSITTLTTPIFIHGSLLFVRLYYFERHFDNIKEKSMADFKMRRSATIAQQRTNSTYHSRERNDETLAKNTKDNQGIGFFQEDKEAELDSSTTSPASSSSKHQDEKDFNEQKQQQQDQGIKFGNLPHPPKRRKSIDPEDMYRSIRMMKERQEQQEQAQQSQQQPVTSPTSIQFVNLNSPSKTRRFSTHLFSSSHPATPTTSNPPHHSSSAGPATSDDDDVLIIKPPNEIENSDSIFVTRKKRLSSAGLQIKDKLLSSGGGNKKRKHYSPWTTKIRRTFSNQKRLSTSEMEDEDDDDVDDDVSIDSERTKEEQEEEEEEEEEEDGQTDIDEITDVDADDEDEDDDDENDENAILDDDDDDEEHDDAGRPRVKRAVSNLELPSKDATSGQKYHKRSNTIDVETTNPPHKKPHKSTKQPTPSSKKQKKKKRIDIRKIKTPGLSTTSNSTTARSHHHYDTEDEETDGISNLSHLSRSMSANYLSWTPTVGRNSTFVHLTDEQKEELGGVEYRAVKLLIKIVVGYYIGFHLLGAVMLTIWIYCMPEYKLMLTSQSINPAWWAWFTAQSSFNDLGLTLTPDSMSSFNESSFVLVLCAFLIVIGNTGFPVFLRFIIWILFKTARPLSLYKESLGFLLDHPRRCFTLLFPSVPTWWLFFILVALNGFDLVLFCIVDIHNSIFDGIDTGYRVLDGLFQAFCTRTVGFSVFDLSALHAGAQVGYMLMMYISVLPLAISIRRTNVYEEQSLGVYAKHEDNNENNIESTTTNYVGTHLRNQLSYDLWYVFLGLFVICLAEGDRLRLQDYRFSVFAVLFEIISAYGTVGMSLGYPTINASLSGEFNVLSKLVIIAMMIRGRHRGLPYTIDRAVMLPDATMKLHDKMQETHAIKRSNTLERTSTLGRISTLGGSGGPIDSGENILGRVITNVDQFRKRKMRQIRDANNNNNNRDIEVGSDDSDVHSQDPHYIVTGASM
ncbi:TRK1 [[Candida] subhashii]|uniref:Potassium transport protein n=1 Tax=[Candida] subhashii TaxID=561895 RepID=A0A8J5UND7_9ASCO|nr:TRK1 [[Candida] subhashii]KAG7663751.1 TRK1 [[Candida] subhashii]